MACRQRLRSKTGCISCRRRRKKCDETKPFCMNCQRLHLSCAYPVTEQRRHASRSHSHQSQVQPTHAQENTSHPPSANEEGERTRHRAADFSRPSTIEHQPDVNDFLSALKTTDVNFASLSGLQDLELEHCLVLGVCYGWNQAPITNVQPPLTHMQQDQFAKLDKFYRAFGHGPVARMAFFWLFSTLSQHLFGTPGDDSSIVVPPWYLPRSILPSTVEAAGLIYLPWPAVRERTLRRPSTYHNVYFFRAMLRSIRFIWPSSLADGVEQRTDTEGHRFSAELSMRARNLRSFALTKDFLDLWQEFRGEAPQMEPSLTLYPLGSSSQWDTMDRLEELYWERTRQRHQSRLLLDSPTLP